MTNTHPNMWPAYHIDLAFAGFSSVSVDGSTTALNLEINALWFCPHQGQNIIMTIRMILVLSIEVVPHVPACRYARSRELIGGLHLRGQRSNGSRCTHVKADPRTISRATLLLLDEALSSDMRWEWAAMHASAM